MMTISNDSIVVAVKSQVSCQVDAETVVLHFDKGLYFGLNELGTLIWNQVQWLERCKRFVTRSCASMKFPTSNASTNCSRCLETLSENGLLQFAMRRLHKLLASRRNPKVFGTPESHAAKCFRLRTSRRDGRLE